MTTSQEDSLHRLPRTMEGWAALERAKVVEIRAKTNLPDCKHSAEFRWFVKNAWVDSQRDTAWNTGDLASMFALMVDGLIHMITHEPDRLPAEFKYLRAVWDDIRSRCNHDDNEG